MEFRDELLEYRKGWEGRVKSRRILHSSILLGILTDQPDFTEDHVVPCRETVPGVVYAEK